MKAALLCPGPSLHKFRGHGQRYDVLIGVNRAALFVPCDYWSICDGDVYRQVQPINRPRIWTRQSCGIVGAMVHEEHFDTYPPATCWTKYSAIAGMVLAHMLGVKHLDCYGCDMAGVQEFDGQPLAGVNRDRNRWADESWWWAKNVEMLGARGMTINRVT
jgi:hypothetical protein